jgi:hypothetical protein
MSNTSSLDFPKARLNASIVAKGFFRSKPLPMSNINRKINLSSGNPKTSLPNEFGGIEMLGGSLRTGIGDTSAMASAV